MYLNHFHFSGMPFSIAPNPRCLYIGSRHREALAHLLYGTGSAGGVVVLTGEVGTGKTTLCRCLLGQIPSDTDAALVVNPKLTAHELLVTIWGASGSGLVSRILTGFNRLTFIGMIRLR